MASPTIAAIREFRERVTTSTIDELLRPADATVARILRGALDGRRIEREDGELLFGADERSLPSIAKAADIMRARRVGDNVTFVNVRNINYTNVCYMGCRFCNFGVRKDNADSYYLSCDEVANRASEAWDRGGTEVCIQGGLHPDIPDNHYETLIRAVKARVPGIHVHAFSPFEIWYGARKARKTYRQFLEMLKTAGLDSMPGTAAEILDTEIRTQLTRNKLSSDEWETIIREAHGIGLRTTATIMYGHIDGPAVWAAHIDRIRRIQQDTGGFTEFVPLGFIHHNTSLYREGVNVRPGPTFAENVKMHAISRLMLDGWVDNIQTSWVKLGPAMAQAMLSCGANDLGGTMMNESISRAAGGENGQEIVPGEMVRLIRDCGRVPLQRNTLYQTVANYEMEDPAAIAPLVARAAGRDPLGFIAS